MEPATKIGSKVGLWIGLAIAAFAAIAAAVYFLMGDSPVRQKVGPMEVAPTSAAVPLPEAPKPPPAVAEEIPQARQPQMVPSVPLPETQQTPVARERAEPAPVPRPVSQPKPVVRPASTPAPEPQAVQPPPEAPAAPVASGKTCSQASLLMRPICVVEGPATFWKCTPNGKRWDNNIPGCRRSNED